MYYTLKQELSNAYTYEHNFLERSFVDRHRCHVAAKFDVFVGEDPGKLCKRPYKSRLIANYNLCTTTELSTLLTYCLTAIKNHVIKYYETVYVAWMGVLMFVWVKPRGCLRFVIVVFPDHTPLLFLKIANH